MKKFIIPIIILLASLGCDTAYGVKATTADSLRLVRHLSLARTAADSLPLLYNLFDLASRAQQPVYAWQILSIGERTGRDSVAAGALSHLSVIYLRDDSVMTLLEEKAAKLPRTPAADAARLFVAIQHTTSHVSYLNEQERHARLLELFKKKDEGSTGDIYRDIRLLYTLCLYLGHESQGTLYQDHMEKLGRLVDRLPREAYGVRNQYLTSAAIIYTYNGEPEKALAADRRLLSNMDELEQRYAAQGRHFRNYEVNRYICLRRMLCNYRALKPGEADSLYSRITALGEVNDDIRHDLAANPRTEAYYRMASGQWQAAIPLLRRQLDNPQVSQHVRRNMLAMLKEAAEKSGDSATLLFALKGYNEALEDYILTFNAAAYRELEIRYDVENLRADNARMEIERREDHIDQAHKILMVCVVAGCLLLVAVLMIHHRYSKVKIRLRSLERELERKNKEGGV